MTAAPKPRIDKLGVKPGARAVVIGVADRALPGELRARGAQVVEGRRARGADLIFYGAERAADLRRVATLARDLRRDGALWVVRPKGTATITERQVMRAGLDAGLVDVKVVSFSDTHTAEKFVYRLRDR